MKLIPVLALATLCGAAAGWVGARLATPSQPRAAEPASGASASSLAAQLEELSRAQDALVERVASLDADRKMTSPGDSARVPQVDIEALVAEAVDRRLAQAGVGAASASEASADAAGAFDPSEVGARLIDGDLAWEDKMALWQELRESGRLADVVAWMGEQAKLFPNDPDKQVRFGEALIQKLMDTKNMMEQGALSMAADKAFDRALELDDRHWEARFQKAVSLSFWPPSLGKQGEAIHHFEVLVDQQKSQTPNPGFASTYLFLGNMHMQRGDTDKALAVWREGLETYPNDAELRQQIAAATGGK